MVMVVKANQLPYDLGGHIASFASSATLYEVGFNHFYRGPDAEQGADLIFFQGPYLLYVPYPLVGLAKTLHGHPLLF
jgi:pyruvate dehydrogenase complex dehydrogenase (E1) component